MDGQHRSFSMNAIIWKVSSSDHNIGADIPCFTAGGYSLVINACLQDRVEIHAERITGTKSGERTDGCERMKDKNGILL